MKIVALILLGGLVLGTFSLVPSVSAQPSPTLSASYTVGLDERYSLFGTALQQLSLSIRGANLESSFPLTLTVIFYYDFSSLSGLAPGANHTLTRGAFGQNLLTVTFPVSTTSFNVTVSGTHQDYSVLYRNAATVPPVAISLNAAPFSPTSSSLSVKDPPALDIFSVTGVDTGGKTQTVAVGGNHYVTSILPTSHSVVVLYQTADRDIMLYLYVAIVVMAVLWTPFVYKRVRSRTEGLVHKSVSGTRRLLALFTSRRLVQVFAGVSLAMLGIALIFGPSPTPRLYLAATPAETQALGPSISSAGFQYLTPANAGDQFNTMSVLGNYNLVIVADYPPTLGSPGLAANQRVVVLTYLAPPQYATTLKAAYGNSVSLLNNTEQLSSLLNNERFYVPSNNLGLPVTHKEYKVAILAEAFLTFLLVFVAMAYLARSLVERAERGVSAIAEGAVYCVAVFMATTVVFVQTSVLLGLPVALHAGISTVESAVGALGFGGGSRPRELMGTLGFVFGAVAGTGGRMKVDRVGMLAFIGVIAFVAIDPLALGQAFYELVVTFTTNISAPTGGMATQNTRDILSGVMDLFGHNVSAYYYSSHGSVLFFLATLPFALFSMLRKSTATFLLLFTAFVAPIGFLRVADLNPTESMASAVPGLLLGLGVVVLFLVASFIETRIRKRLPTT